MEATKAPHGCGLLGNDQGPPRHHPSGNFKQTEPPLAAGAPFSSLFNGRAPFGPPHNNKVPAPGFAWAWGSRGGGGRSKGGGGRAPMLSAFPVHPWRGTWRLKAICSAVKCERSSEWVWVMSSALRPLWPFEHRGHSQPVFLFASSGVFCIERCGAATEGMEGTQGVLQPWHRCGAPLKRSKLKVAVLLCC